MLSIRLQRVGRRNEPTFRIVLTDSKNGPKSGKSLEVLGSYDSRRGEKSEFDADRIKYLISKGAQLSGTMHNLLIEKKVIEIANEINFVTNKADLLPSSLAKINELILILIENPEFNIVISGHTDDVGSEEFNLTLSEKRTQSVIDYLINKGIAKDRMVGLSYGESKLKVNDATEDARSVNRRVEIKVYLKK